MTLDSLMNKVADIVGGTQLPKDAYSAMKYPKFIPLMHFNVNRYRIDGFGQLMCMHTTTKFGMELLTCSFMPYEGNEIPYLLIDIMAMRRKLVSFTEFYDCTKEQKEYPQLKEIHEKYNGLPEYQEKPAWYVNERAPYSLIKGSDIEDERVFACITDTVQTYMNIARTADRNMENLEGLKLFRERMITEGNPSTNILNRVLGTNEAKTFFKKCVMPLSEEGE